MDELGWVKLLVFLGVWVWSCYLLDRAYLRAVERAARNEEPRRRGRA